MIDIPKLKDIYNGIVADIEAAFSITLPTSGKNFLRTLSQVQAGKLKLFYLTIALLQKNIFPDTADPEAIGGTLERFGRTKLGRNPFPAIAGVYVVTVTGAIGALLKTGTVFKSNDDSKNPGMLFILDSNTTLTATSQNISLRALSSGTQSSLLPLDQLTATAPIASVDSLAIVVSETTPPTDAENIEVYRTQILKSFRLSPQGGAPSDYILWAQDVPGVKTVYPYAKSGFANEINIYVEATGDPVPSSGMLAAVKAVIEMNPDITLPTSERGRQPLGIFMVHYLPVSANNIDINITGFASLTSAIQAQILAELTAQINLIRPFIAGADVLEEKNDILDINKIISIVLSVRPGSVFGTVTLKVNGVPYSTRTFTNGNIPVLNTVTYV